MFTEQQILDAAKWEYGSLTKAQLKRYTHESFAQLIAIRLTHGICFTGKPLSIVKSEREYITQVILDKFEF